MGERKEKKKPAPGADLTYRVKYLSETPPSEDDREEHDIGFTAMDVYEDEAVICLELELAGVNPKDVVVRVNRGLISIEGVKKEPPVHGKSAAFHCAERTYGSFKRMFAIHGTIDEGKIEAEYRNGVLTLRLPKVQERRKGSHTIRVRIND